MGKGLTTAQINAISGSEVKTRMLLTLIFDANLLNLAFENDSGICLLETGGKLKQEILYIYLLENDTLTSLTVDEKIYLAGMVQRGRLETQIDGGKQSINVTLSNINQVYSNILAQYGDILTNAKCIIEEVIFLPPRHDTLYIEGGTFNLLFESGFDLILENDYIIDDKINIFEGYINNVTVSNTQFTFDIERLLGGYSTQSPNSTYDVSCQFAFKDARCQYTGSYLVCDKTLTACQERSNSARFGGYPSIPAELVIRA